MSAVVKQGPGITRRGFLAGSAGLSFALAFTGSGLVLMPPHLARGGDQRISAWVRIRPDNIITILTPVAEMGQGSMTSVPLILAEEMDADWDKVILEWAPAESDVYGYASWGGRSSMAIVGSRAVRSYFPAMRAAGAQVRKVLLANAAREWEVPVSELSTEPSVVVHAPSGRRLSYGEIAASARIPDALPEVGEADLKPARDYRLIGHSQPRRDIPAKVDGTARFAIDVQLPGMLYATTVHSPVQGAPPLNWNASEVEALPGIRHTVKLPEGVAIVGDAFERVQVARAKLKVDWGPARAQGYDSEPALERDYARVAADPASASSTVHAQGDAEAAFAAAARTYKAEFRADYGYHAQMEPLNATARLNDAGDNVEVWDGTQSPDRCRAMVAEALGFDEDRVTVHQCYMGGGFGRRSLADYTVEAALAARAVERPVKLIWTREEDLGHGMFRPQNYQCLEAALDAAGRVSGWKHCVVGDGGGLLSGGMEIPYYGVPNQHLDRRGASHGIRLKHWRAVAHVFNVFAIESFVDQMADAEGIDPIEFRLNHMAISDKGRRVFEKVAEMCGWGGPRPEGRALGLSLTERSGSLGAAVAEISLDRDAGRIRVHRFWIAVDAGTVVQPDAARANVESGVMQGLSSVLHERVTVKGGRVQQSNYHDYHLMRMADAPETIHVEFVNADRGEPTGIGEIGNPPVPAAVATAFYRLTGKRLTHMPFTPERVKAILQT